MIISLPAWLQENYVTTEPAQTVRVHFVVLIVNVRVLLCCERGEMRI